MFNIDKMINIEKILEDLNTGIFTKTYNGKTYKIKVEKINDDIKNIKVFNDSKQIIDFNYYKDGKIQDNNKGTYKEDKNKVTLNDIIAKMINLSEGYAKLDNMSICVKESKKIDKNSSTSFKVEIEDENFFYEFAIPFTNEYYVYVKSKNNDLYLNTLKNKNSKEKDNRTLKFMYNDTNYVMTNDSITNLNNRIVYFMHNNTLLTKLDKENYIGYNFDNNKVYTYIKKVDSLHDDLEKDFTVSVYNKNLNKAGEVCNGVFNIIKSKIKENIEDKELNGLLDNIKMPTTTNYDKEYDELLEIVQIFNNYKKYLNLLDDEQILNSIYHLITNANITVVDNKVNDFVEYINNNNLKDLNTLKNLKVQLKEIIKLKKKQDKTKKKILKNTDIEN